MKNHSLFSHEMGEETAYYIISHHDLEYYLYEQGNYTHEKDGTRKELLDYLEELGVDSDYIHIK
ncbi:MAG: hypothetical protein WCP46_00455 [Alphaproteobacteria bacterium]